MRPSLVSSAIALSLLLGLPSSARAGWVLDWNLAAQDASLGSGEIAPEAARSLAILHAAMYDAVNAISGGYTQFYVNTPAPLGANESAAAAAAAKTVLDQLYPTYSSTWDTLYSNELATIADSSAKTDGINWGSSVGTQIYNWRLSDGASSAAATPYSPVSANGRWGPTPNVYTPYNYLNPPLLPGWRDVTPFGMNQTNQFRPSGMVALTSTQYASDYNEVFTMGAAIGSGRSADQTTQAYYWADLPGHATQVAHWNTIAGALLGPGANLATEARVMAALNVSLADAAIAAWDAKYASTAGTDFDTWRPVAAITYGDDDNNPATFGDFLAGTVAGWNPLIDAPPTPEYISDVAAVSGAAGAILKHYFGDVGFSALGDSDGNGSLDTLRSFGSISDAMNEAAGAGVLAGTNFRTSTNDGLSTGQTVGDWTTSNYFLPVPEPSSALLGVTMIVLGLVRRRRVAVGGPE